MDEALWYIIEEVARDMPEGPHDSAQERRRAALRQVAELFRERSIEDIDELREQLRAARGW